MNGPGTQARFDGPIFMAMDANQNIIIGEGFNHSIRKITPAAFVTTVSGNFNYPLFTMHLDGTFSTAKFELPSGVDIDAYGNIYVADTDGHCIRKLGINGIVTTIAGGTRGFKDGKGAEAQFCWPADVAVDAEGNVYVTDTSNNRIRKIAADGTVTTIAGNGGSNVGGAYKDGVGVLASFNRPWGITIDMEGNLIVSDSWNGLIRKITMK